LIAKSPPPASIFAISFASIPVESRASSYCRSLGPAGRGAAKRWQSSASRLQLYAPSSFGPTTLATFRGRRPSPVWRACAWLRH
jgi:hypothetical protein